MNADQLAALYAIRIKEGEMTKSEAIMYYRNRHNSPFIESIEAIEIALGNLNEFGRAWEILTELDPYATL